MRLAVSIFKSQANAEGCAHMQPDVYSLAQVLIDVMTNKNVSHYTSDTGHLTSFVRL